MGWSRGGPWALAAVCGLAASLAAGCTCSGDTSSLPDVVIITLDAGLDSHVFRDGSTGCDDVSGEGCPCSTEGDVRSCTTGGVGACGMGTQVCVIGFEFPAWGPCGDVPEPSDEDCDGIDDDCDGSTDEGLGELACGEGACAATTPACSSGVPQTCTPIPPRGEECNLADDDCDGTIDEALGSTTCGTGACRTTVAACEGGVVGVCTPGMPGDEICNGADDDCDGATDEALGTSSCGTGACAVTVPACTGGAPTLCVPGTPTAEACNGLDDDCDGVVDNGFGTLVCGTGACRRVVLECSGSGGATCTPGTPAPETCNGLDDDCDGTIDDGIADVSCGVGACARTQPACAGGMPQACTPGMPSGESCNGIDDDCDGMIDDGLADLTCGLGVCRRTAPACSGGMPGVCVPGTAGAEVCGNRLDDDCDGMIDELCSCDPAIDRDFDGYNQCGDCDDANGAINPGRAEACNGQDDDCDMRIDEAFDADRDGFGTCSMDPTLRDCDDRTATTYPGAPELCAADGRGDGVDNDCDGYIDELCTPCDDVDDDRDGFSECAGDCDDMRIEVRPGAAETCDGLDTDCNRFTVDNCGVSDPCNFPGGADVCRDDLLCGCVVSGRGTCTGTYVCTSFCEGSYTGELGAGCASDQVCQYRVTVTDNLHGCAETTDPIGALGAGAVCTSDAQCRSGTCDRYCVGGPGCSTNRCIDYCTHDGGGDGSCATGTVCEILRIPAAPGTTPAMYATCRLDDNGTRDTGAACSATQPCRFGAASCVGGVCAEPCALRSHCPSGTHCSLRGNAQAVGTFATDAPPAIRGMTAVETVPVCLANTGSGLHNRPAGSACSQNGDCASQFCESTLRVCVDLCTSDATCPTGLGCELAYVRAPTGIVSTRVCLSAPTDSLLQSL